LNSEPSAPALPGESPAADRTPSRRREWRHRLVLLAASTFVALVLAEAGLRILHRLSYDTPLPYGLRDDRASRIDAVRLTPNFSGLKGPIAYRTNADGWRDEPIDPSKRHIVFLGDSCTFGVNIQHEETYPERVEKALGPPYQSVNTATPGQGTTDEEHVLAGLLQDRRVDIRYVVIGFFFNDIGECVATREAQSVSRHPYLRRIRLLRLLKAAVHYRTGGYTPEKIAGGAPLCHAALARIAGMGKPVLVVILPKDDQDILSREELPWRAELKAFLDKAGIQYVDMKGVYQAELGEAKELPASFYSGKDDAGHPGPGACEIIAREIVKRIKPALEGGANSGNQR
jgi:lysophospholipase L1-like esterase